MDKPKCRICGEKHWGNCQGEHGAPLVRRSASATPAAIARRFEANSVMPNTTPASLPEPSVTPVRACPECELLRAENARLQDELREARAGKLASSPAAERMRRMRQRRKEAAANGASMGDDDWGTD
jgi:hypothetical protein